MMQKQKSRKFRSVCFKSTMKRCKKIEIILDPGSTISLFKNREILSNVKSCGKHLVIEANVGAKAINKQARIPGNEDVYYDEDAVSNLFNLSELVKYGNKIFCDSSVEDCFIVSCKNCG